jgi:hypothetical protein
MALSAAKRTTTLILDTETDRLLNIAAHERGVSRSEFIRAQLRRALEQCKTHPKPRSAGVMRRRAPRDEEASLFERLEPLISPGSAMRAPFFHISTCEARTTPPMAPRSIRRGGRASAPGV